MVGSGSVLSPYASAASDLYNVKLGMGTRDTCENEGQEHGQS